MTIRQKGPDRPLKNNFDRKERQLENESPQKIKSSWEKEIEVKVK